MFPEVRARTARAVREVDELCAEREGLDESSGRWEEIAQRVQGAVGRWAREMEALGVDVKGPWLVDFDSGSGYYCWKWPEERLEYFHGYEEGFAGRTRIQ